MAPSEVEEEGQLDSVLESSENIVVVLDGAGKIVRISRGVKSILGYGEADLIGASIMSIVPLDRRDWMSAISKRAREDGIVPDVFIHWRTKDGRRLITKSSLKAVVNYQHDVVGMIISEEAGPATPLEGAMTPDQAMQLIHASEIAIVVTDLSGNIITFSSGAEKLTGFASSNVIGSSIGRIFVDRAVVADITTRGLRDGKVEDCGTMITMVDELKREVSVSLSVRRNPSGAAMGFSFVMFDISKRKELERELELRAEKLRLVNDLSARIRSGKSLRDIYLVAAEGLKRMINFDTMSLLITSETEAGLKIASVEGEHPDWLANETMISMSRGPFAKALKDETPVVYTPIELEEAVGTEIPKNSFKVGLAVPLYAGERDLGFMNLTSSSPSPFSETEINLIILVSDHIALAAEATRLLMALMENINIQTTMIETSTAVRSEIDLEGAYLTTVSRAKEIVSSNLVALYMEEEDELKLVTSENIKLTPFPNSISNDNISAMTSYYFSKGEPFIKDISSYQHASDNEKSQFGSIMMAKLIGRTGPMGVLVAAKTKGGVPFTQYEFELLNLFCNHVSPSLENAQLFEDTRKSEKLARQALVSERRTQEALHFLLDMFAHDTQNQIQGILGYLELIGSSDVPAEAHIYLDKAIQQVRAGSNLVSGTAHVFKNLDEGRSSKTTDEILIALKDALRRFSMIFLNVEVESLIPAVGEAEKELDSVLSELFFHVARFMHRASKSKPLVVEMHDGSESHLIAIEFRVEKGAESQKMLKTLDKESHLRRGTMQLDPFLVRLLGEVYGATIQTSERTGADGNLEEVLTMEFEISKRD